MISHYADSIRELGTPDGYNTEGLEYLHIVYVKRGWEASNKREGIRQIIKYCQRLEALRIHRAHLDEFYEPQERRCELTKTAVFMDDDGDYNPEAGDEGGGEPWEDIEPELGDNNEDEEDGEEEGRRRATTPEVHEVEHPAPEFAIAVRPTTRATLTELGDIYGATSLERALRVFLRPFAHSRYFFLPHEHFDVWHKLTLYHRQLSFAPDEPSQRDVIRVRPPVRDEQGRLLNRCEPVFDTALFVHDCNRIGLHRYRAGRVRAIFRLPERLHYLYEGELVYLELFTPFDARASPVHHLHTTSHVRRWAGDRQSLVVPIENVVLACHLTPQF
ncbi:hypothetical protein FRC06_004005 [Ceratobasidium sp. 370]|nr:hypothetical protein FRC06_004005 [Ceratobasidium sp. 370]